MQQQFGEYGVGFVSMKSISADNRTTVKAKTTGNWKEENLRSKSDVRVYLSGFSFYSNDGEVTMQDATVADKSQVLVKTLICGHSGGPVNVRVNGVTHTVSATKHFNHVVLDSSVEQKIMVGLQSEQLPVYGISFEPVEGVVLDNYSFRGITGIELKKLDTACLREIDEEQYYDLVILEYGVNVLWKADDKSYPYYRQQMKKVLPILRKAMPHTEFLIISTADRAFMYDEAARTALGIDSLIKTQADLAFENGMAFYNMYESMGGYGTIVKWADMEQPLARKDYIHPNHQGAERLGKMLYNDFMNDYSRFENQKH
jgi:lysophospholipase L1-like esterase